MVGGVGATGLLIGPLDWEHRTVSVAGFGAENLKLEDEEEEEEEEEVEIRMFGNGDEATDMFVFSLCFSVYVCRYFLSLELVHFLGFLVWAGERRMKI